MKRSAILDRPIKSGDNGFIAARHRFKPSSPGPLDRATQYPRASIVEHETLCNTGRPVKSGDDGFIAAAP